MTHGRLAFDISGGLQSYVNCDDDRSTAIHQHGQCSVVGPAHEDREDRHEGEEQCTDQGDSVDNLLDVLCGGLAGSVTQDGTTVVLQIVGNLNGIERNCDIEVCKCDDQNEEQNCVDNAVTGTTLPEENQF